ncbi:MULTISPECIES: hypothetical protein [unclassified Mycobacterium]|uniref:hypothetical protein n=1 Tax=unclassified Mycobacterium TaxID=2642494 RepID=UPI0007FF328A|nr:MULTISPECIES: hypothetical protein [unclassified Mycobacterium]OBG59690.1 hypothetical protein A5703_02305 [Mycobacterium sp. E188]OBG67929.1 hypothetical protein A5704_08760 [Mycobacterium sp. E735]OBG74820.1 hypothetical protein A9X05_25440 [Mycobacterium sp. E3298]OBG77220.1 hypothetical protein A5701_17430 [Mycobacterium sp. E3305]OBH26023.1 hypothetical protein A9X03_12515 [Mycobacterium sp. E1715]
MNGVEPIERGLARLRDFRWDLNAQPLRELRLEVDIVYFTVPVPFSGGRKLSVPFLTMIKRVPPSPTGPAETGP